MVIEIITIQAPPSGNRVYCLSSEQKLFDIEKSSLLFHSQRRELLWRLSSFKLESSFHCVTDAR